MGPGEVRSSGFFLVFVVDIDARYDELNARGIKFVAPPGEETFGRAAEFRDPEGHPLWLWQLRAVDDPRRAHVEPHSRHHAKLVARLTGG
jgi:hypothetical protein